MANPGTAESKTSKRFQRFANLFSRATKPASSKAEQEEFYEEDDDFLGSEFGPNSLAQFRSAMSCTEAQVLRSRSQSVLPSPQRISGSNIPNGRSSPAPSKGPLLGGAQALANALARRAQSFSTRQNLSYNPNAPPVQNKSVSVGKSNYGGGVVLPVVSRSGHPDVLASAPQQYFDASLSNSNSPSPMGSQRGMLSPRSPVSRSASSNLNTSRPQPPPPLHVPQMNTFFQDEVTSPVSAMPSPVPPASMRSEKSFKRASAIIVDPMLRSGQDWSPAAAPASPAGPQSSNTMSSPGAVLSASNTGLQRSPSLLDRSASGKVMEQILSPAASQEQPRRRGESRVLGLSPCVPPTMQRPMYLIEDYTLMAKLHASATCSVYKAFCKWSMTIVALKVYETSKLTDLSRMQLAREAELHLSLDHPHILKLYAVWQEGSKIILLQEFAEGGDLFGMLCNDGGAVIRLEEEAAVKTVIAPLLKALHYLHSRGILHRDIKLENLLFRDAGQTQLLLADFGIAINLQEERGVTRAGTLDYMSPEVLRCPGKVHPQDNKHRSDLWYTHAVDTWAVGVLAYELLNGCPPFAAPSRQQTEMQIMTVEPAFVADNVSSAAEDFVFACLVKDPEARPTPLQLLSHPWVRTFTHPNSTGRIRPHHRNRSVPNMAEIENMVFSQSGQARAESTRNIPQLSPQSQSGGRSGGASKEDWGPPVVQQSSLSATSATSSRPPSRLSPAPSFRGPNNASEYQAPLPAACLMHSSSAGTGHALASVLRDPSSPFAQAAVLSNSSSAVSKAMKRSDFDGQDEAAMAYANYSAPGLSRQAPPSPSLLTSHQSLFAQKGNGSPPESASGSRQGRLVMSHGASAPAVRYPGAGSASADAASSAGYAAGLEEIAATSGYTRPNSELM